MQLPAPLSAVQRTVEGSRWLMQLILYKINSLRNCWKQKYGDKVFNTLPTKVN